MNQTTINESFSLSGQGLHTGRKVTVHVHPAAADSGILFRRTDRLFKHIYSATADHVGATSRGTSLGSGRHTISTIEHLMSALHGMQIDNALVEVDGGEVPILDGSAKLWILELKRVGVKQLDAQRRVLKIDEPIHFEYAPTGSVYDVVPSESFSVNCIIDFPNTVIGRQEALLDHMSQYCDEISPCRTFVFLEEIELLLKLNLIKGGSLDNALVFVNKELEPCQLRRLERTFKKNASDFRVHDGLLNTTERYFPNEPARHKLLDFVGDIRLVGLPVIGRFTIYKPGHKANTAFASHLMKKM